MWLGITLLWLLELISFTYVGIVMVLVWGSVFILSRPAYRFLNAKASSLSRHMGLWALSAVLLVLCLWPVAQWFSGQGAGWQNRWVWPSQEGSAVCVFQSQEGAGAGRHRFIVAWPLGSVANVTTSVHDVSFAWAHRAQQQPAYLANQISVYQQQLGPYFNQALGYRLLLGLGWQVGAGVAPCDFSQPAQPARHSASEGVVASAS